MTGWMYSYFDSVGVCVCYLYKYQKWQFFIIDKNTEGYLLQNMANYMENFVKTKYFADRIDCEYFDPVDPNLSLDTSEKCIDDCVKEIIQMLEDNGRLKG